MSHQNSGGGGGYSGSRGRSSGPNNHLPRRSGHAAASTPFGDEFVGSSEGKSQGRGRGRGRGRWKHSNNASEGSGSKHFNGKAESKLVYRPKNPNIISNSVEAEGNHKKQTESQDVVASGSVYGGDHHSSADSDSQNIHLGLHGTKIAETPQKEAKYSATKNLDVISNSVEAEGGHKKQIESQDVVASGSVCGVDHHSSADSDSQNIHLGLGRIKIAETPQKEAKGSATTRVGYLQKEEDSGMQVKTPQPLTADTEDQKSQERGSKSMISIGDSGHSVQEGGTKPLDICPPKKGTTFKLKPSLLVKNRQKRNEVKRATEGRIGNVLRPGMVLLKNYLSISDQVNIVKTCRDLGMGPGGFYQPGYRDGASLHLKMMCLGKNWDPEKSAYEDVRSVDGAIPPKIPADFNQFVMKAIEDSHALIERNNKTRNAASELPWMSPDICIVNFYPASGKLGLHQDRDESPKSLNKGLPVVSFSVGDTAEFLYGDERDVDKADKVLLESGDVIIFGGKSRRVFHGVAAIIPNTTPEVLQEETNFLPGRLNLTFRQY